MSLEEYADKFRVRNLYVPEQLYGKLAKLENIAEQERMRSEATDKRSEVLQESGPGDGPGSGSGATLIQSSDPNGPDRGEPNAETSFFATTTKASHCYTEELNHAFFYCGVRVHNPGAGVHKHRGTHSSPVPQCRGTRLLWCRYLPLQLPVQLEFCCNMSPFI